MNERGKKGEKIMFRFTLRFMVMFVLLIFGILLGMNMAEKGIYRVAGNPNTTPHSFQVSRNNNTTELQVLGKTYVTEQHQNTDQSSKEDSLPRSKTDKEDNQMTFIGKIGERLGFVFQKGAEKGLNMLANLISE